MEIRESFFKTNPETETPPAREKVIDKATKMPAYLQLAKFLRTGIARGEYLPGKRLPSESALAKLHGVSAMTARQAVSELEKEGLVNRIQGRGTFVRKVAVSASSFELNSLSRVLADKDNLAVRIVNTAVKKTPGTEKEVLGLEPGQPVIQVERILLYENEPFTLHVSYTNFDPRSPIVESMLDTVVLTDLIFQEGYSIFKRGILHLLPTQLDQREAALLKLKKGESIFKLEHLFYDFDNKPAAFGWFLVSHEKMPLVSKIGIWDE